jgi:colicin import membrane protein
VLAALLLFSTHAAKSAEPGSVEDGHARIEAERRVVEAHFTRAQAACQGRFLLTRCLDAARDERRLALDKLQRQQLEIDDLARRERAAKRRQMLQKRDPGRGSSSPAASVKPLPALPTMPVPVGAPMLEAVPAAALSASPPARHRAVRRPPPPASVPADSASAAALEKRKQADYLKRQQDVQAHRESVLERNARQDALSKPAAGLPVPPAALPSP